MRKKKKSIESNVSKTDEKEILNENENNDKIILFKISKSLDNNKEEMNLYYVEKIL